MYKSSGDEAARSRQRWATVESRFDTLRNRLDHDINDANKRSGASSVYSKGSSVSTPLAISTPVPAQHSDGPSTVKSEAVGDATQRVVKEFYNAIGTHRLNDAYALLSNNFRSATSPTAFRNGYRTTVAVNATTSVGEDPSVVSIDLIATDGKPGSGATFTTHFKGRWRLIWDDSKQKWLLDDGQFSKVAAQ